MGTCVCHAVRCAKIEMDAYVVITCLSVNSRVARLGVLLSDEAVPAEFGPVVQPPPPVLPTAQLVASQGTYIYTAYVR